MKERTKDSSYFVSISSDDKGSIKGFVVDKNSDNNIEIEFSPKTVLGDLFATVTYKKESAYEQDNYKLNRDYVNHPFFNGKGFHHLIWDSLNNHDRRYLEKSYFVVLTTLKDAFEKEKPLTMNEFEIIKQFHALNFTCKIWFREDNPMYGQLDLIKKFPSLKNNATEKYQYETLSYRESFDERIMLERLRSQPYRFEYRCYGLQDVIFSVLHYLSFLKYKFSTCNHCGRYYATHSYKVKYCQGKSPCIKYDHLECEQAVKNMKQQIGRRKTAIEKNLAKSYKDEVLEAFLSEYYDLRDQVQQEPTVENLNNIIHFLSKENISKHWYLKENRN